MTSKRGKLIVVEGLDRSGKSTQCSRLVEYLYHKGEKVEHLRFPNRSTPIGQMINNYLSGQTQQEDHVIHLLFSANRWESAQNIEDLVSAGTTVVIDRYYYSGCVYSAAKHNPSMDLSWCRQPEVGLPRPDVCIFLNVSAEKASQRGGFGVERYENKEMQDRVRDCFRLMRMHSDEADDIVIVDAGQSIDEVAFEIQSHVDAVFEAVDAQGLPLRRVKPWL